MSDKLPLNVLNNYFSVGIDAHIALNFHRARNSNPEQVRARAVFLALRLCATLASFIGSIIDL